ncbi:phage tail protein [Edwardsiella tarda]|uniref:phage tail protein n=1 Tax=Edwardsiella tarda TaxID=636 RepID=UPI002444EB55|nr:phage tail protein [Edwardsiella tarda]WGE29411.1 phage tail protein [Edwardsiella tarda]
MPDKIPPVRLPSWFNRGEIVRIKRALLAFWQQVHDYLHWPLRQTDPLTCDERILRLRAWQYDITRFNAEPLALFRRRVKFAFINARDAGSTAGFKKIFERLGIGYVEIHERNPGMDWDIVLLHITDSQLANNSELLSQIIRQYGRTCRRYRIQVIAPTTFPIHSGLIHGGWHCFYVQEDSHGADHHHYRV